MKLGDYLTLAEATASARASRDGIDNSASELHAENLRALVGAIYDPLRANLGKVAVSSCYRSEKLNAATPGSSATSQHCFGEAMDLVAGGKLTNAEVFLWIRDNLPFDQLIWENGTEMNPDWVHVSYTRHKKRRGEVLRKTEKGYIKWFGPKSAGTRPG